MRGVKNEANSTKLLSVGRVLGVVEHEGERGVGVLNSRGELTLHSERLFPAFQALLECDDEVAWKRKIEEAGLPYEAVKEYFTQHGLLIEVLGERGLDPFGDVTLLIELSALETLDASIKALQKEDNIEESMTQTFVVIADGDGGISSGKLATIAAEGAAVGVHLIASFGTKRSLAAALGVSMVEKAMNMFDSRVFAVLNSSEAGAAALGLPEKPANEEERFTLWEASRPNRVEVFIPYKVPSGKEWDELEAALMLEDAFNLKEIT